MKTDDGPRPTWERQVVSYGQSGRPKDTKAMPSRRVIDWVKMAVDETGHRHGRRRAARSRPLPLRSSPPTRHTRVAWLSVYLAQPSTPAGAAVLPKRSAARRRVTLSWSHTGRLAERLPGPAVDACRRRRPP